MFGNTNGAAAPASTRPAASDVARVEGTLTQVLVSGDGSDGLHVFLNGQFVPTGDVESLTVEIVAPDDSDSNGTVAAVLSRYENGPAGRTQRGVSLLPGTIEVIARGRRVVVTGLSEGSFDGLWLGLGLRADGTSSELTGVQSLRLAAAPGLLDARLIWSEDGRAEDLLPEA